MHFPQNWCLLQYSHIPKTTGVENLFLLYSGARLEVGTILSKTMNKVILPLSELSRASFSSDRFLLNTRGGVESFSDLQILSEVH